MNLATLRLGVSLIPAMAVVLVIAGAARLWRMGAGAFGWLGAMPPVTWLTHQVGRLPAAVALPLFMVPELFSRAGWVVSVWLLVEGRAQTALLVYAGSKLVAGLAALLVYRACRPALMSIGWFARMHDAIRGMVFALRAAIPGAGLQSQTLRRARVALGLLPPE